MATCKVSMLLCITLFTSHVVNTGWALHIDIEPSKITEEHSGFANVTCTLDNQDSGVMTIMIQEIIKDGGVPLVYLQPSGIAFGASLSNTAKADGVIDADLSKSFLKLSLLDPRDTDGGEYTCKMFFLDSHAQVTEYRASSNLTIENINVHEVVRQLAKQVTLLEKQLATQTSTVTLFKGEIARMADEVTELKGENRNLSSEMARMAEEATYSVSFSASLSSSVTVSTGSVVLFDDIRLNEGNCYDRTTGEFTAPRKGLYLFQLTLMTSCPDGCIALVYIQADGVIVASWYSWGKDSYDQTSISGVVPLAGGAKVKAVSDYPSKLYGAGSNNMGKMSKFSGHLVRVL